jgi:phosphatidylserine/phosphatidylglycerophosphate/cardiolipin synthase-like enzyme
VALSRFGADKTDHTQHLFNVGGVEVQSFFSPTDGTTAHIVDALNTADHNLRIAMYTFTQNDLGDAVLAAHDRPGVLVQGDVEDVDASGSEFNWLVSHGVELYSHLNEPGLLHHKYAIIDEGTGSDPLVVTGSHNWTATAEAVNDENTLIIHDATIANLFYQEWNARHNAVAGIDEAGARNTMDAWPVPARDQLHVSFPDAHSHEVILTDVMGRIVARTTAASSATLDVSDLPAGVYTLNCISRSARSQRTVMVMR